MHAHLRWTYSLTPVCAYRDSHLFSAYLAALWGALGALGRSWPGLVGGLGALPGAIVGPSSALRGRPGDHDSEIRLQLLY